MPSTGQDIPAIPEFTTLPRPVWLRAFDMPAGFEVELHSHPWGQLMYAASGVLEATTEQHNCLIPPRRAMWLPAGVSHSARARTFVVHRSFYLIPELAIGLGPCRVLEVSPLLDNLIQRACEFPHDYPDGGPEDRLMQVLVDELHNAPDSGLDLPLPRDARLRRVTDHLQEHPGERQGIEDWAQRVGASRRTLARLFRDETGLSFREWRERVRLLAALPRLERGESVTLIAGELGYESTSAFIELFQRQLGTSPGALARQMRTGG
ncbi:MAG: helix-turn-helix transcriptional regulator [Pseudomonas sp.]